MEISEVRVKLVNNKDDRLKAFCSITFDNEFVVRDIKIIEGNERLFVAMPSRKMSDHCQECGAKNHLKANYCSYCGVKLSQDRVKQDSQGRVKLHADIAHPINSTCREKIQKAVVAAYEEEVKRSQEPDYTPTELDEPLD